MSAAVPNYLFVVGAQKAGTTWLWQYLAQHPDVHVPQVKEVHYFDTLLLKDHGWVTASRKQALAKSAQGMGLVVERLKGAARKIAMRAKGQLYVVPEENLEAPMLERLIKMHEAPGADHASYKDVLLADYAGQDIVADITPDYALLSANGFAQMSRDFPGARFVFILRDPVSRTWSHIKMHSRVAADAGDRQSGVEELLKQYAAGAGEFLHLYSNYPATLEALEASVENDHLLVMFYEDLFSDEAMQALCDFLEVKFKSGAYGLMANAGSSVQLPEKWHGKVMQRTLPIYEAVVERFGAKVPDLWKLQMARYEAGTLGANG
jgi:hypothetical protein